MGTHPSTSSVASSRSIRRAVCALVVCVSFAAPAQEPAGPSPFGSSSALLFYNAANGEGATARIDSAGTYGFVGSIPGFAKGWTHITGTTRAPRVRPGATSGVLFYNASTGDGATARLDGAGNYTFVGGIPGFAKGWTHIVSANQGSLLFYNAASGEGATARLDSAGTYGFVASIPGFAKGWTHIAGL